MIRLIKSQWDVQIKTISGYLSELILSLISLLQKTFLFGDYSDIHCH